MKQPQYTFEYLAHEDEAQQTGVTFIVLSADKVSVQTLFLFPEYQQAPVIMTAVKARLLYSRLLHDADYRLVRRQPVTR